MSTVLLLREAAALMRRRANAASRGTWQCTSEASIGGYPSGPAVITRSGPGIYGVVDEWHVESPDAEHIASWHPAVALAVADLVACPCQEHADAAARAYLGRDT